MKTNILIVIMMLNIVISLTVMNTAYGSDVNTWETLFEPTTYVKDLICDPDIPNRMYGITEVKFENGPTYYLRPSVRMKVAHGNPVSMESGLIRHRIIGGYVG